MKEILKFIGYAIAWGFGLMLLATMMTALNQWTGEMSMVGRLSVFFILGCLVQSGYNTIKNANKK